ncbi:MAG: copper resistance protein CopC [Anaerolineaceae bacterium]|nr:copper resistance protein CopC [Anaerolineaceae bacterium]
MKRFWVILLLWGMAAVFAPRVVAHAELVSASPAPGSSVQALTEIRLEFSEPVAADSRIELLQNFVAAADLTPTIDPANANMLVTAVPPLADGVYTVQWTVTSVDGHPISGSYSLGINSTPLQTAVPWHQSIWAQLGFLLCGVGITVYVLRRWRPTAVPKRTSKS